MRHYTPKRERQNRAANEIREALKESVGRCELCMRQRLPDGLCCHEIFSGTYGRRASLDKPYAILVLCREPHWRTGEDCHRTVQGWPEARQLALLYLADAGRYDLEAYNRLVNERAPNRLTQSEVDRWLGGAS